MSGCVIAKAELGGDVLAGQTFVDISQPEAFQQAGFLVASAEELSMDPKAYVAELSESEMKEVGYFGPTRIGDVIFNHYD